MIVDFFPLDIGYEVNVEGKNAILLFGRTVEGKKICVFDTSYEPYFYVFPSSKELLKTLQLKIESIKIEYENRISFVLRTDIVRMSYMDEEIDVLKVYVQNQRDLDDIKREVREIKGVEEIREGDIAVYRKYLIDKDISPSLLYRVTGDVFERNLNVDLCIKAERVELVDTKSIEKPKIISFDIEVYCEEKKYPVMERDPILMIAIYSNSGFRKVLTWKKFNADKFVEFVSDENELLRRFEEILEEENPDYLVGYFSDGFDLPYIYARAKKNKLNLRLGDGFRVVKRADNSVAKLKGIVHLDIFKFIKGIMGGSLKLDSYKLGSVASELLKEQKVDVELDSLGVIWDSKPEELQKFCDYNLQDARITLLLCEKILPNLDELVRLTGQPIFDICRSSYSQLVERYLMKRAKEFKEIYPNKPTNNEISWRRMHSYEGGFVYEPKAGLYENIAVLDYMSLYPSLIIAKNISPSMLTQEKDKSYETPEIEVGGEKIRYYFKYEKEGFISKAIKDLVIRRNRVKELIKKEEKKNAILNARSYGLKTIANAMYGYLGFFGARWYCAECVASITAFGREYIKNVIKKAEENSFMVVYSDTDSVVLVLKDKTKQDILRFLENFNRELPSLMEIELEDFYTRGIFVMKKDEERGAKKKYALLSEKGDIKVVGFETIRRDWSYIAKEVQKNVLEIVLKEGSLENALNYVKEIIKEIKEEKIPKEKMIIQTQLKKRISSYDLVGPHVIVARRMKELNIPVGPGSVITYIVNKGRGLVRDKAKLPEESGDYDPDYYIRNQVIPSVERIFSAVGYSAKDVIDGKDQSKLYSFWEK